MHYQKSSRQETYKLSPIFLITYLHWILLIANEFSGYKLNYTAFSGQGTFPLLLLKGLEKPQWYKQASWGWKQGGKLHLFCNTLPPTQDAMYLFPRNCHSIGIHGMGDNPVALEPNRFKLCLEPRGKQSRISTGKGNTSGKYRVRFFDYKSWDEKGIGILWVIWVCNLKDNIFSTFFSYPFLVVILRQN